MAKSLFQAEPGARKGERTRIKLLESAFLGIARDGYYRTTFQTIADRAGVSQPLVVRLFRTREEIFPTVAGHLLELATEATEARLSEAEDLDLGAKLEAYFEVSVDILRAQPDLARFYVNIYYLASYDERVRAFYTTIRRQALSRLSGWLKASGAERPNELAAALHDLLSGHILNVIAAGGKWNKPALKRGLRTLVLKGLGL